MDPNYALFPTYKTRWRARCFNCGSTLTDIKPSGGPKGNGFWRGTCSGDRTQPSMKRDLLRLKPGDLTYRPRDPTKVCPYITWFDLGPKNANTVVFEDDVEQTGVVYLPGLKKRKKKPFRPTGS